LCFSGSYFPFFPRVWKFSESRERLRVKVPSRRRSAPGLAFHDAVSPFQLSFRGSGPRPGLASQFSSPFVPSSLFFRSLLPISPSVSATSRVLPVLSEMSLSPRVIRSNSFCIAAGVIASPPPVSSAGEPPSDSFGFSVLLSRDAGLDRTYFFFHSYSL